MTTPPSSLPPANWYPDPQTPGQLRYWDGQRWTQHVHPAQQPAQGVGGAGAVQPQAGPGVFLPSGRPGSAQPGQGSSPAQGAFMPTQGAFMPTQGGFTPGQGGTAASPATGAQPLAQVGPAAAGPGTGSFQTFQPGAGGRQAPLPPAAPGRTGFDVDDIPRGRSGSTSYDLPGASGTSRQSQLALLFSLLALLTTGLSVYGLGTDYDAYVTYAAGGVGFISVFFGFAGLGKALQGWGGRGRSILAVGMGFLAIGLNTYEYLNPRLLYDLIAGLF